nr:hypothetical protein [Tanacetum cinerariifolium]
MTLCFLDVPPELDANGLDEPVNILIPRCNNGSQERHHMINRVNRIISFLKNRDHKSILRKYHSLDKRLTNLVMMILVRQTEDCDMLLHMVTTDMKLLVVEIEINDITADDVDKASCSTDVEKSKQVDLNASIELHLHDIHVVQDKHEVDQRW